MKNDSPINYILDTDIVTHHQHGHVNIARRLALIPIREVAISVVSMHEQLKGRLAAIHRGKPSQQIRAFALLQRTQQYYCAVPVVSFDAACMEIFKTLSKQKIRIGTQDLRIAATALAHSAVLVTNNRRHFDQVPELKIENWLLGLSA